ncbi:MAG TPA: methyltransferase domain-containing protein [Ignavibacteriaceae bacterium]|nr:methyltransferase domain-containing protein [Ignavibacteriaceae bacterium]
MKGKYMTVKPLVKKSMFFLRSSLVQLNNKKEKYQCSICGYHGPFLDVVRSTGLRKNAQCPKCQSFERHRLIKLVIDKIGATRDFSKMSILHIAPEPYFRTLFQNTFKEYLSADLERKDVDINVDLRKIPFEDKKFDMVVASHVLEHIKEDTQALSEIRRILKPNGVAILPVPVVSYKTIEYPQRYESGHVRAPGFDYFDRYKPLFSNVEVYSSKDFPEKYQTYIFEDRDRWPTKETPMRLPMKGTKHLDVVPVCYV